jgi:medium-chain acyl-[acyl-carrier-protein] hydrolase
MPKKITDTIMNKYGVDEPLPGEWSGRKLPVPKEKEEVMRFEVRPFQLDKNGHMNNERYVSAAIDLLPEGTAFSEIQVGYVSQALLDDEIIICRGLDDKDSDKEVFNLEKEDGSTLCTVIIKVRA